MTDKPRVPGDSRGFLYRYIDIRVADFSYFDDDYHGYHVELRLEKYRILKRTPQGAWIDMPWIRQERKFVLLTAYKQFACEGTTLALRSFIARKKRQIGIYGRRKADAQQALAHAERMVTPTSRKRK